MKIFCTFSAFVFMLFAYALPLSAACSKPLSMAYSDWGRVGASDSSNNTEYGLDYELLRAIMNSAGCTFERKPIPFKRLLESIKHGTVDGATGSSLTVPRQAYAWFTEPYRQEIMAMFMLSNAIDGFNPRSMEDIAQSGFTVGLGMGAWHGAKLENQIQTNAEFRSRLLYVDDFNLVYQWLQRGRVKLAINDLNLGYYILKRNKLLDDISVHPFTINADDVHIMLSKKSVSLEDATLISEAVGRFRGSDLYNEILAKYSPAKP